jgi:hypothetical protein
VRVSKPIHLIQSHCTAGRATTKPRRILRLRGLTVTDIERENAKDKEVVKAGESAG